MREQKTDDSESEVRAKIQMKPINERIATFLDKKVLIKIRIIIQH
jgi:hypothetical protein